MKSEDDLRPAPARWRIYVPTLFLPLFGVVVVACGSERPATTTTTTTARSSPSPSPTMENMRLGLISKKTISETSDLPGCILSLTLADEAKGRSIFVSDLEDQGTPPRGEAIINLNGKEIKLRLIEIGGDLDLRVGARSWKIYTADDITLRCDFTLTGVCSPPKEDCGLFPYKVILTVSQRGQKAVVKTVGSCGS